MVNDLTINVRIVTRIAWLDTQTHRARRAVAVALFKLGAFVLGTGVEIQMRQK